MRGVNKVRELLGLKQKPKDVDQHGKSAEKKSRKGVEVMSKNEEKKTLSAESRTKDHIPPETNPEELPFQNPAPSGKVSQVTPAQATHAPEPSTAETPAQEEPKNEIAVSAEPAVPATQTEQQNAVASEDAVLGLIYDAVVKETEAVQKFRTQVAGIYDFIQKKHCCEVEDWEAKLRAKEDELRAANQNVSDCDRERKSFARLLDKQLQEIDAANSKIKALDDEILKYQNYEREVEKFESDASQKIADRDNQIKELNAAVVAADQAREKDRADLEAKHKQEISKLEEQANAAATAHADEIQKLTTEHEQKTNELKAAHSQEIEKLKKDYESQIDGFKAKLTTQREDWEKRFDSFVPAKICKMFAFQLDQESDKCKNQVIYAYLAFINGNLRPDVFPKRFRVFDEELYGRLKDNPDQLAEWRRHVQQHINDEIGKKSGGLCVEWPKIGSSHNPEYYQTKSEFGQRVVEVMNAMVYQIDSNGKRKCLNKGIVRTE